MQKLLYPFQFFYLHNTEVRFINAVPTIFVGAIIVLPFLLLPEANFFGSNGFLGGLIMLTAALTGFYVAALTAAATFAHADLDKTMVHGTVKRWVKLDDGSWEQEMLTRREFVCMLFGFLAFSAMVFTILGAMALSTAPALPQTWKPSWANDVDLIPLLSVTAKLLFSLWVGHLFGVTSLGLYYLMDRLHRRDKKVITPSANKRARAA